MGHEWPGNIRELANTVAQAVLMSKGLLITVDDLPPRIVTGKESPEDSEPPRVEQGEDSLFAGHSEQERLVRLTEQFEELLLSGLVIKEGFDFNSFLENLKSCNNRLAGRIIDTALDATYGNQVKAARLLGITPRALRYYMDKHNKS